MDDARASEHDFQLAPPQLVEVRCECGQSDCTGEIALSLEAYEEVRVDPRRFVIKEGHEVAEAVRVVGYGSGYLVVARYHEKLFSFRDPVMSGTSAEGYAVARRPIAARLQEALDSTIVEQAEGAISARLGTTTDVAYEILLGLARSQGREIAEYAQAVVARDGLLDA